MSDYLIQFNVFDGATGKIGEEVSPTGHVNVTFIDLTSDNFPVTIGANQSGSVSGIVSRGVGSSIEGEIVDESNKLTPGLYSVASCSVPVTKEQFESILEVANGLADARYRYDYALFDGPDGHAQTCVSKRRVRARTH
ncbi:MAG: hypothetical protein ACSHXH_17425, partial [Marivita sp.]|uniref:hypothetical protein n=1 Tax=Marivita sp. TaxID=2003365 RepID=UPI003EF71C66